MSAPHRRLAVAVCGGLLVAGTAAGIVVSAAATAAADTCAPGFVPNPYTAQCLSPVTTPVINGQPCIASNIALCSSFVQNQQPPRGPRPVG